MVSPTIRLVEIEIDGALKGNPRALGAGGLIRDGWGAPITTYMEPLGDQSSHFVEIWGLFQGVIILKDLPPQRVIPLTLLTS